MTIPEAQPKLVIDGLTVTYSIRGQAYPVVRDVDMAVPAGQIVGIVGESGCGKSTLAAAVLGLLPANGAYRSGAVRLDGDDLVGLTDQQRRHLRGRRVAFIPQDPLSALNPTLRIETQLVDVQRAHLDMGRKEARARAAAMLEKVGIPAGARIRAYPHEFSGGMRQRILIAMALLLEPDVIVADEPTSALDATLDAQILELLRDVRDDLGTAILLITHDLGSVAELCDRVVVMYAGEIVEDGTVAEVLKTPRHPYTQGLVAATPSYLNRHEELRTIPGRVPDLTASWSGCGFADRCAHVSDDCRRGPIEILRAGQHSARCVLVADNTRDDSDSLEVVP